MVGSLVVTIEYSLVPNEPFKSFNGTAAPSEPGVEFQFELEEYVSAISPGIRSVVKLRLVYRDSSAITVLEPLDPIM